MNPEAMTRFIEALRPAFETHDALAAGKGVESENVARLEEIYRAITRGDYEALQAALAEDVELEFAGPPESPITGRWRGRDQVIEAAARNYHWLEDQTPELLAVLAQGDQVAVIARERGRMRITGREYQIPWLQLFTFRDGRIVRIYGFNDSHAMIQAAGTADG